MNDEQEITLTHTSGFWWWKRSVSRTYRGSGTVWHDVQTGARPGTLTEARLSEIAWLYEQRTKEQTP